MPFDTFNFFSKRDLDAPGVRLFCFPHAGSGAAGFYRWKRLLPASIAVCPVLLPGREGRLREPLIANIADLTDALLVNPETLTSRPYVVFGHSMGALLGYEWVRRLASRGLPQPTRLLCSGRNAPQQPSGHSDLHRLPAEMFLAELKARYGGEPEAMLHDPELRDVFLPILRNDLRLVERYIHACDAPLYCSLFALAGRNDQSVSEDGLARWAELTSGSFDMRRFPGDHFYSFGAGEAELVLFIAGLIEEGSSAGLSSTPGAM